MRMAYHPYDCELLPQAQQGALEGYTRGCDIRYINRGDICSIGTCGDFALRCERPQRPFHKCCVQHLLLSAARGVCRILLRSIRDYTAFVMEQQDRRQVGEHKRNAEHISHGIHPHISVVLMHRSYHRIPACGSEHSGQYPRPHHRYAWICHRSRHSVHSVCHVPQSAEVSTEVGWMDECGEGGVGIHRTGLRTEVPVGGRPCLRMAYPRPRNLPIALDCNLRSAWNISPGMAQVPA